MKLTRGATLVLASHNKGKLREFAENAIHRLELRRLATGAAASRWSGRLDLVSLAAA